MVWTAARVGIRTVSDNGATTMKRLTMVTAAILIVTAICVCAYVGQKSKRARLALCRSHRLVLLSVIESAAFEGGYSIGDKIPETNITDYIVKEFLVCPSTGRPYDIPPVGGVPTCSYHGNLEVITTNRARYTKTNRGHREHRGHP